MTQAREAVYWNDDIKFAIDAFLTRKRRMIVEILAERTRLSQGELADAVDTSGASLSNILLKFEQFEYKLLDSESEGKRRYYFLTDLGNEYVNKYIKSNEYAENVVSREAFQTMKSVKSCLENIKNIYDDKWEMVLDDALIACIEYQNKQFGNGEEEIDAFLISVEKVLLYDYENYSVKLMKLVATNPILVNRLELFFEVFEAYRPLLEAWDRGVEVLHIYDFLESVVMDDSSTAQICIQRLGWKEKEYKRFSDRIRYVMKRTEGENRMEIYKHFNRGLMGNQALSAFLAKEIYDSHMRR